MFVEAVYSTLVRFKCARCGKTFTFYPDFAIPHKHYTRQTVVKFSGTDIGEHDQKTYKDAVMTIDGVPECSDKGRPLAPSTIHRWICTLAGIFTAIRKLGKISSRKGLFNFCKQQIPKKKYRTLTRKAVLLKCRGFLELSSVERVKRFSTEFAIESC